ncbi:MAG: 2-oxoacid:acceptor oxidoreductase family protein, partial [Anaerolineales bacterium]
RFRSGILSYLQISQKTIEIPEASMREEVIISGFGGQGVLFAGKLLTYAGLETDLQVVYVPSYGPEMRGGTAHCTVILSGDEIGSPFIRNPSAAIVMNIPSLERYEPLVKTGGILVVNTSLIDREPGREDIAVIAVPALPAPLGPSMATTGIGLDSVGEAEVTTKSVNRSAATPHTGEFQQADHVRESVSRVPAHRAVV